MKHAKPTQLKISIKRAYEAPVPDDGYRVLVDRVWPRGRSKETLMLAQWARDIAPSAELRQWFGHDPQRWDVFQQRYRAELEDKVQQERLHSLLTDAAGQPLTL